MARWADTQQAVFFWSFSLTGIFLTHCGERSREWGGGEDLLFDCDKYTATFVLYKGIDTKVAVSMHKYF